MSINPEAINLERSAGRGRYRYQFPDGSAAELSFVEQAQDVVAITHTFTPPQHRGQGIAAVLVEKAVADFREAGLKVIPACWFAREQFRAHPDWAVLLARS